MKCRSEFVWRDEFGGSREVFSRSCVPFPCFPLPGFVPPRRQRLQAPPGHRRSANAARTTSLCPWDRRACSLLCDCVTKLSANTPRRSCPGQRGIPEPDVKAPSQEASGWPSRSSSDRAEHAVAPPQICRSHFTTPIDFFVTFRLNAISENRLCTWLRWHTMLPPMSTIPDTPNATCTFHRSHVHKRSLKYGIRRKFAILAPGSRKMACQSGLVSAICPALLQTDRRLAGMAFS